MLTVKIKTVLKSTVLIAILSPVFAWACDAARPNTHIGQLMSVNAEGKTFTIQDAQSRSPITFAANNEIIDGLKDANGSIMVNYKEDGDQLTAVGVTF